MPMNPNDPIDVLGTVTRVDISGFGPNSGELTVVIQPSTGGVVEVFAAIMTDKRELPEIEHGVFAAYAHMASLAYTTGKTLACSYLQKDKARINWMSLK